MLKRESGETPELSRSGEQERTPNQGTGPKEDWEARQVGSKPACKSEDLPMGRATVRGLETCTFVGKVSGHLLFSTFRSPKPLTPGTVSGNFCS